MEQMKQWLRISQISKFDPFCLSIQIEEAGRDLLGRFVICEFEGYHSLRFVFLPACLPCIKAYLHELEVWNFREWSVFEWARFAVRRRWYDKKRRKRRWRELWFEGESCRIHNSAVNELTLDERQERLERKSRKRNTSGWDRNRTETGLKWLKDENIS